MHVKARKVTVSAAVVISAVMFYSIVTLNIPTDIQLHSIILTEFVKAGGFPVPPAYYFIIYALSGFSLDPDALNRVAIIVLSLAVGCKYLASVRLADAVGEAVGRGPWRDVAMLLVMFLAPVFYDVTAKSMYLGRVAPNVWHNSTTITVMPIAILTFVVSLRTISGRSLDWRNIATLLVLGIANALVKPSFLFALIPSLPFLALVRQGFRSPVFIASIGIAAALLLIVAVQYYAIYQLGAYNVVYHGDNGHVAVAPFRFWSIYSKHIALDISFSLVFPITYLALYPQRLRDSIELQYALVLFAVALAIGILLCETGERLAHGNFFWQIVITSYLLFAVTTTLALDTIRSTGRRSLKSMLLTGSFAIQFASGLLYIFKIFYTRSYW